MPYDEWLDDIWNDPTFTAEGSFAAVVDGEPVSIALLLVAPELGARAGTRSRRRFRSTAGRGLALAAKAASLRWAARNGVTRVSTANDDDERADARDQPPARVPAARAPPQPAAGRAVSGNGRFASPASTCAVTHTGVAAYRAE